MSERITQITLQAFRGVPESFTLCFDGGRSCIVLGDNATGKSSIVDAIELYFRGTVEALNKEGRKGAIRHTGAPPKLKTQVTVATDGVLGGTVDTKSRIPTSIAKIGRSEFPILRGRTLVEFVEKTKGEKYTTLAELLGFDAIDELRRDLQSARNDLQRDLEAAREVCTQKTTALSVHIVEPSRESIFAGLVERSAVAEIAAPGSIEEALDPDWWKDIAPNLEAESNAKGLNVLLADANALSKQSTSLNPLEAWNQFVETGGVDTLLIEFHRSAQKLLASDEIQKDRCPLCNQPAQHHELTARVTGILRDLEKAESDLDDARKEARKFVDSLKSMHDSRLDITKRAKRLGLTLEAPPEAQTNELLTKVSNVEDLPRHLAEAYLGAIRDWDKEASRAVEQAIPEPATERERALVEIGVVHTLAIEWRDASREVAKRRRAFDVAERLFNCYQERQSAYLNETLGQISTRCAEIYSSLHPHERIESVAVEVVSEKGAELVANFHGHREQPIQRVLSESHLSSLGLALFLAMAETFNDSLGFLVLDDVISSFDRSHRGRLAELLASEFEDRQLIVLTNDEQFFTRLGRLAPSWVRHELTTWSFEAGPQARSRAVEQLLEEAKSALETGDRTAAAQKGRRVLEGFLQEACEELEALLPFRRGVDNERRMAEEVMQGFRRSLKDRARAFYKTIDPLLKAIEGDLHAALNWEAHATQGGTSNREIADVLSRVEGLINIFTCDDCATRVWRKGSPESGRCSCGASTFPPQRISTPN